VTALAADPAPAPVPEGRPATEPPEQRGLRRDQVRLLVASPTDLRHARFLDLPWLLAPGDLLVVNRSATMAAALTGHRDVTGDPVTVHVSTELDDGSWVVELRPSARATGPLRDGVPGEHVLLADGAVLTLLASYPQPGLAGGRLWRAAARCRHGLRALMAGHGRPIGYAHLSGQWPLAAHQTVFASQPGSAEMPSAGRPFTRRLVRAVRGRGVAVAGLTLHAGVSSLDPDEPPLPERFEVPDRTARLVNRTRSSGGLVVAVGTTVTRALESVASTDGTVRGAGGWTDLVLGPHRPARAVDGLVTGWHPAGASHLQLLTAVAGGTVVGAAYTEAARAGYLWHEFGDSALFLPVTRSG
jgi:S-adenosylmethionine:tRNA ribosyltransferase-isomerase